MNKSAGNLFMQKTARKGLEAGEPTPPPPSTGRVSPDPSGWGGLEGRSGLSLPSLETCKNIN